MKRRCFRVSRGPGTRILFVLLLASVVSVYRTIPHLLTDQNRLFTEVAFVSSQEPQPWRGWSLKGSYNEPFSSPGNTQQQYYNFTVAICSIVKDAEMHLEEWIDYHLLAVGFQNMYLYDNSDNFDLQRWYQNTRQDPVYSRVTVRHWPGMEMKVGSETMLAQQAMNTDCIRRYGQDPKGPRHDYFGLFDEDEYVVIQNDSYSDIRGVLQDYLVPFGGGLSVNWMLFGTSNHTVYAPVPITKRFQYRDLKAHTVVKVFAKADDFDSILNPHAVNLLNGAITRTTKYPGAPLKKTSNTKASDFERPSNVLLLYHYRYTSEKEYLWKRCHRGNGIGGRDWCSEGGWLQSDDVPSHVLPRPGKVFDDRAWKLLMEKVPRYKVFDDWPDFS